MDAGTGATKSKTPTLWMAVAAVLALTALARLFAIPGQPTHFDEGQYLQARVWPWVARFDHDQAFFSPPLYPFLVGLFGWLGFQPAHAGVLVNRIAALASFAFAWLLFRRMLPPDWYAARPIAPGIAFLAGSFGYLALCQSVDAMIHLFLVHALTDTLYAALLLAALWSADRAYEQPSTTRIVVTGGIAGLSWLAKYSGPMTLLALLVFCRTRRQALAWLGVAAVSAAVVAPWYWAVERHIGLATLLEHQRGYFKGFAALPANLAEYARMLADLHRSPPWGGWVAVFGIGSVFAPMGVFGARTPAAKAWWRVAAVTLAMPALYTPYLRLWLPSRWTLLILGALGFAWLLQCEYRLNRIVSWTAAGIAATLLLSLTLAPPAPQLVAGYRGPLQKIRAADRTHPATEAWLALEPPALIEWARLKMPLPAKRLATAASVDLAELPRGVLLLTDWRSEPTNRTKLMDFAMEEFHVELSSITLLDEFRTTRPDPPPTLRVYWRK